MKKIELMIVVVAMVLLAACDDFIDTVPKGKVIPTTMDDFKSMIIDVTASSVAYPMANVCSDDVFNSNLNGNSSPEKLITGWKISIRKMKRIRHGIHLMSRCIR